jgi:hypothetical protein
MNPAATEEFWQFSLETYARPGVSAACIALQDTSGCDVNILLLALYAGMVLGHRLDRDRVTQPLRAARRNAKAWAADPEVAAFRAAVQATEIEAERLAQRQLLSLLDDGPIESPCRDLALANLAIYAGSAAAELAAAISSIARS